MGIHKKEKALTNVPSVRLYLLCCWLRLTLSHKYKLYKLFGKEAG